MANRTNKLNLTVIIFGLVGIMFLMGVLILNTARVINLDEVLGRPKAAGSLGDNQNWVQIENNDSHFSYSKSTNPNPRIFGISQWNQNPSGGVYQYRGGTAHQSPAAGDPNSFNGVATLDLSSGNLKFDKLKFGFMKGTNRGIAQLFVDGNLVKEVNQRGPIGGSFYESEDLGCAAHKVEIKVTDKTPDHKNYITVDYVDVHGCGTVTSTPTPTLTPTVTPAPNESGTYCQGDSVAAAKCFSCLKDEGGDEVNIFDFRCFADKYGKSVGN